MKQINMSKFVQKYLLLLIVFFSICLVVGLSVYKIFLIAPTYVFAKIKIGQGLWWASTQKPPIWFIKALKKGDTQTDFLGNSTAEIISVRHYLWGNTNQYDIYLTAKLRVSGNQKNNKYIYNREPVAVGAPIDFEFPSAQFSGTIIDISTKPFNDVLITKTVYLTKKNAFPWEYDAIQINDEYFDGQDVVFQILDKEKTDTSLVVSDEFGNYPAPLAENRSFILVKAVVKGKMINNQLIIGEDQIISINKTFNITTNKYAFQDFEVSAIE